MLDKDPIWMSAYFGVYQKNWYPKKFLTYLGNRKIIPNNMVCNAKWSWAHVDWPLYESYQDWQGIEYETIGDGIYRYLPKDADEKS